MVVLEGGACGGWYDQHHERTVKVNGHSFETLKLS